MSSTAHGSQTARGYRVVVENRWWVDGYVEWFASEANAAEWIAKHNHVVLSEGWAVRVLDY